METIVSRKNSLSSFTFIVLLCFFFSAINSCQPSYNPEHEYVGSSKSNKFHVKTCKWAKKINPGNLVSWPTYEDAIKAGRIPCKFCKATTQTYVTEPFTKQEENRKRRFITQKSNYDPEHYYVGSRKSDRFHIRTCPHVKKIKKENLVSWATYEEAIQANRIGCKTCRPTPQ